MKSLTKITTVFSVFILSISISTVLSAQTKGGKTTGKSSSPSNSGTSSTNTGTSSTGVNSGSTGTTNTTTTTINPGATTNTNPNTTTNPNGTTNSNTVSNPSNSNNTGQTFNNGTGGTNTTTGGVNNNQTKTTARPNAAVTQQMTLNNIQGEQNAKILEMAKQAGAQNPRIEGNVLKYSSSNFNQDQFSRAVISAYPDINIQN